MIRIRHLLGCCALLAMLPVCSVVAQEARPGAVELFIQQGHSGRVNAMAVSADGRFAVSGGSDKKLIYWDLRTGTEIRAWANHPGTVEAVSISPDGTMALAASAAQVNVWSLTTGKELRVVTGLPGVISMAFSPDGQHVLLGDAGQSLTMLYVVNWLPSFRFNTQSGAVNAVAFSPDGKSLASAHTNASLKLWDRETADPIRTFSGHRGRVTGMAFSPDGTRIVSGSVDRTVKLWDVASGSVLNSWVAHSAEVAAVAFCPNGKCVASTGTGEELIKLWNVHDGQQTQTLAEAPAEKYYPGEAKDSASALAFTPDGKWLLSGQLAAIKVWDVAGARRLRLLAGSASAQTSLAISPDGSRVLNGAWSYSERPVFNMWSLATGKGERRYVGHANPVNSVAFSPDGLRALTASDDKTIKVWDLESGAALQTLTGHTDVVFNAVFSPDGRRVMSSSRQPGVGGLKMWDVSSGRELFEFSGKYLDVSPIAVAFTPNGKLALSSSRFMQDFGKEGEVYKDMRTGENMTDQYRRYSINTFDAFSGDTERTFFARRSVPFVVFAIKTAHTRPVIALAVSPDGALAITGAQPGIIEQDKNMRLWRIKSGEEVRGFAGHVGRVTSVAFSPDGRLAVSAEGFFRGRSELLIKLWDVESGALVRSFAGHTDDILSVAFSKDGRQIVSASSDHTTRVWDAATGKELIQHVRFNNGEWISITPEGYFAASSARAAEFLKVRIGMTLYRVDQFYDAFYRPDIVEAALAGKDTASMAVLTLSAAIRNPPPKVERVLAPPTGEAATIKVTYRIKADGGGIGEVRVFHNGKLVQSDGGAQKIPEALLGKSARQVTGDAMLSQMRSLAQGGAANVAASGDVRAPSKPDLVEATINIEPVPGENDIAVVAFNAQNTVQSEVGATTYLSRRAPVAPRLHILTVGIDEYQDKSAKLNFAVKDARDIAERWKAQAANIYGAQNIFVETITNAQATRSGVLARINAVAARVKSTDHFILFVAAHGVLLGEQYYMVTNDYNGELQPSKLISANEIVDFSKRIKALSQLYILDTCHAGGMDGVVSGLYDARVSVLAKKMGLHVFASASSTEEAIDGFEGNGLFTHTLLSGLNNNRSLDVNADSRVSLMELGLFSKTQTKRIASKARHSQDPLIISFGQDSPVYRLQ